MDRSGLNFLLDQHKNKKFWKRRDYLSWKFQSLSSMLDNNVQQNTECKIDFIENSSLLMDKEREYITIGRGWP